MYPTTQTPSSTTHNPIINHPDPSSTKHSKNTKNKIYRKQIKIQKISLDKDKKIFFTDKK